MSAMCDLTNDAVKKRETVGKVSTDLLQKAEPVNPIEQMRENLTDYEANIVSCVDAHKKHFPNDFYIVVITKKERLLSNVIRNYFSARLSCPTPDYDQTVYKYNRENDQIEFLWTIPARDISFLLLENKDKVVPEEYGLLEYVLKFHDGTLFALAQKLNKEIA